MGYKMLLRMLRSAFQVGQERAASLGTTATEPYDGEDDRNGTEGDRHLL